MLEHTPTAAALEGERYTAKVPDTLDLAARMSLAINALTNAFNVEEGWALNFGVDFSYRPPVMSPNGATDAWLNITPKFIEALVLCRLASGSDENLHVDGELIQSQLDLVGEDGLSYAPEGWLPRISEPRGFSEIWGEGRSLIALSMLAQVDGDSRWIELGRRKIDRLLALSRKKQGYRFFWKGRFRPGERVPDDADDQGKPDPEGSLGDRCTDNPLFRMIYSVGALGHGAALFLRVTGYEPARELSRGLARWALARHFNDPLGRYAEPHFHHGLYALIAVAQYGVAAGDREALERVDACYRWARVLGDETIGYYTEVRPGTAPYLGRKGNQAETCEVADMVFLALTLTRNGIGEYWDDVDRWVRNVFSEAQMRDAEFLESIPASRFKQGDPDCLYPDRRDSARRTVGAFFGQMRANDGFMVEEQPDGSYTLGERFGLGHCCTANGSRTYYYVWDSIVTEENGEVRVNLLLNRASPWLDIESWLPVEGKVVLRIKGAQRISVRMPEWMIEPRVAAEISGRVFFACVENRRLHFEGLRPGDVLTLSFPIPERSVFRVIGEIPYLLRIRGSNVMSIEPRGHACPLYEKQPTGRLIEVPRFVSGKRIIW